MSTIANTLSKAVVGLAASIICIAASPAGASEPIEATALTPDFVTETGPATQLTTRSEAREYCAWGGVQLFEHRDFNRTQKGFVLTYCAKKKGWRQIYLPGTPYNDKISSFRTFRSPKRNSPKVETKLDTGNSYTARRFTRGEARKVPYVGDPRNDRISSVLFCGKGCKYYW